MVAAASSREAQTAAAVLMVRPAHFGFNRETAPSNAFQEDPDRGPADAASADPAGATTAAGLARPALAAELESLARAEFDAFAARLERAGVTVAVAADSDHPAKPDAIFPNNWVSFHADGTVVLYPLLAANRRAERREQLIEAAAAAGPFLIRRTVDLSAREREGKYLEGTGSLVLDRVHRLAYASLSPRTHLDALADFAHELDYELVTFESADRAGSPIYHTNVMLSIGRDFAIVCGASIGDARHREAVYGRLRATHHDIIEITFEQLHAFAGNALELTGRAGAVIALSSAAWRSLDAAQRRALERHGEPVLGEIPLIERHGGGSVRCMLAEIHLPRRLLR
jgi:hypothetical protein